MNGSTDVTPELQHEVEQWYYREARLLDGRQYQTWLGLCAEDIRYVMPGRSNPLVDNAERGREEMICVDRELEGVESDGLPIRDETYPFLAMRVGRAYAPNSWAENPPARTRRIIGNVEIREVGGPSDARDSAMGPERPWRHEHRCAYSRHEPARDTPCNPWCWAVGSQQVCCKRAQ